MTSKIKINTDRLKSDTDQIQTCINNITNEIQNLQSSLTTLESMWEGPSCKAFHKAFSDDMKAAETIVKNLKSILDYDRKAKKEYEQCDKKVSGMIADIKV